MAAWKIPASVIASMLASNFKIYVGEEEVVADQTLAAGGKINAKPLEGYRFTAAPTIYFKNSKYSQSTPFTGLNADKTYCETTLNAGSTIVYNNIIGTTEAIPAHAPGTYTVTADMIASNTAAHVKLFKSGGEATVGTTFSPTDTFTLTPNTGYKITGAGFQDTNTGGYIGFTVNSDGSSATFINETQEDLSGYSYSVDSQAMPAGYYIVTQSDLTKLATNRASMYKGDQLAVVGTIFLPTDEFRLIPNEGYVFQQYRIYFQNTNTGGTLYFTLTPDRKLATFTNTDGVSLGGLNVLTELAPVSPHTISQVDLDNFAAAHAKLTVNGSPAVLGTVLNAGDVLRATANDGWTFYQSPDAGDGALQIYVTYSNTGERSYFWRDTDSFTTGKYTVAENNPFGNISVSTVAAQPEGVKGFNNVYEVSDEKLKLITQSRWVSPPDGSEQTDYGKYILGLINLPFKIRPDMVVTEQKVRLGPLNTSIDANFLSSDTIRLPLGKIKVVGTKGNFLDYKDTVAMLHLPYCNSVALDLEMVIGQTVSIEYLISLYDGTAVVNVTSSKTGDIVLTQNIDMNITIPFANINTYPSRNAADSVKLGGDNGIRTAFIELLRNDAVLESGFFTIPIIDEKPMSGYTGFARVEEINLASKATSYEKELIVNKLNAGVIIK